MADTDMGGCKLASATISGSGGVYGRLKFESGIHRVQVGAGGGEGPGSSRGSESGCSCTGKFFPSLVHCL